MAEEVAVIKLKYEVDESQLAKVLEIVEQTAKIVQDIGTYLTSAFTVAENTLDSIAEKVAKLNSTLNIQVQGELKNAGGKQLSVQEQKQILDAKIEARKQEKDVRLEEQAFYDSQRLHYQDEANKKSVQQQKTTVKIQSDAQKLSTKNKLNSLKAIQKEKEKNKKKNAATRQKEADRNKKDRELSHQETLRRRKELNELALEHKKSLKELKGTAAAATGGGGRGTKKTGTPFDNFKKSLKRFARDFDYIADKVKAFGAVITTISIAMQSNLNSLGLAAQRFRVNTADLYTFGRFIQSVGGSADEAEKMSKKFKDVAVALTTGYGDASWFLGGFGAFGANEAYGKILGTTDANKQLNIIADTVFSALEKNTIRNKRGRLDLNDTGYALLSMADFNPDTALSIINAGGLPAIKKYRELYKITDEMVEKARDFRWHIGRVQATFSHLATLISVAVAPAIDRMASKLEEVIADSEGWRGAIGALYSVIEGATFALAHMLEFVKLIGSIFDNDIGRAILKAVGYIGAMIAGLAVVGKVFAAIGGMVKYVFGAGGVIASAAGIFARIAGWIRPIITLVSSLSPHLRAVLLALQAIYAIYLLIEDNIDAIADGLGFVFNPKRWFGSDNGVNTNPSTINTSHRNQMIHNEITVNTDSSRPYDVVDAVVDAMGNFYQGYTR